MNQVAVWLSALAIGSLGFSGMESDAKAEAETSGAPAQAAGPADGVGIHARDSPILSQADDGAFASSTASLSKAQYRLAEFVLLKRMDQMGNSGLYGQDIAVLDKPPTDSSNSHYVSNRAPLPPSPFVKLPIGAIQPRG